ncbi:MAG: hypothetical protein HFI03_04320 [Lachnospiraceae bacterium]|jgi:hypothetical protein|nr:hypothetical protein [Lachnospiraceae bacterium]
MMEENKRKGWKIGKRRKAALILAGCLIFAGMSFTVYSKYYKTRYEKGMAIASGFYFSSNYMYEEEGLEEIEDIAELTRISGGKLVHEELVNRLMVAVNKQLWGDDSCLFDVEVRNYTNLLLYNDTDLNVGYTVEFALLDVPTGAVYDIRKGSEGSYTRLENDGKGNVVKAGFEETLEGGKLSWDDYELKVSIDNSQGMDYQPSRVLMMAYPTSPDYLKDTKKIAGIIMADYNQRKMEITDQKLTVEDEADWDEADWKERLKKESAFVYQLKTTGNYYAQGNNNMKQKIRIIWDAELFELNKNDKYREENDANIEYKDGKGIMTIETMPYSSIKFVFFKKDNFDEKIEQSPMSWKDFSKNAFDAEIDV